MFRIIGCITSQHNIPLLLAAFAMCVFACSTARALVLRAKSNDSSARLKWKIFAGAVAGTGIWATHFVAMLAYQTGLPMQFNEALTISSALIAIAGASWAGALATRSGTLSGAIFGMAVIAMHYVGMTAVEMPARFVWDEQMVIASIILGVMLGSAAGRVSALPATWKTNVASTALRIMTILGIHFTAMAALTVIPMDVAPTDHTTFSAEIVSLLVVAAAAFVVSQALILAVVDRHLRSKSERDAARMRAYIIELEQVKAHLEHANSEAEAASKSKSAFLASMSHELRTPLNAILGFSETILTEMFGPLQPKYREYLGNVHESGKHLLEVINDVLDIARFDAGHAELCEAWFTAASNTLMILSINTSTPVAQVAPAAQGTLWGQFYPLENLANSQRSMDTYAAAGVNSIIVTVDQQASFYERTEQDRNLGGRAARTAGRGAAGGRGGAPVTLTGSARYRINGGRLWYTWEYIDALRKMVKGKLIMKGVLEPEDARLAIEHGVDAIICSNHGGRSMDYGPSSLESLPDVVAAVNRRIPVIFDGGLRRGTDIFKALALGANAVMLGRTTRWALSAFGTAGAQRLLEIMQQELIQTAAAAGCARLSDINKAAVKAHFV